MSFKIEVVCARASVFSTISTFLNVKKPEMSFILTSQESNYPFASKLSSKTLEKRKGRRHFLDELQPLDSN